MPARASLSSAPIQSSRSGLTGFFTSTGTSVPFRASAISCTAKGLAVVRAPIQSRSIPCSSASRTCRSVATSVATYMPVVSLTSRSHASPSAPTPSKPPGLVRGFHRPARKIRMPACASFPAVSRTCPRVSALQGPAMTRGRSGHIPGSKIGFNSMYSGFCFQITYKDSQPFPVVQISFRFEPGPVHEKGWDRFVDYLLFTPRKDGIYPALPTLVSFFSVRRTPGMFIFLSFALRILTAVNHEANPPSGDVCRDLFRCRKKCH